MPGPDLDRLVAEAMGWKMASEGTESWWSPPGGRLYGQNRSFPADYSTKFGRQTQEMIDWIRGTGFSFEAFFDPRSVQLHAQGPIVHGVVTEVDATAPTLPHAISLLVLAVAEWFKKGVDHA